MCPYKLRATPNKEILNNIKFSKFKRFKHMDFKICGFEFRI